MANKWAASRSSTLLRVEEGIPGLERELRWTLEQSIASRSFFIPASNRYSHGFALALTGHRVEALALWKRAYELIQGSFNHVLDDGTWGFSLHHGDMHTLLFGITWILDGRRNTDNLDKAVEHLCEAERRALRDGLELGEDGYEKIALLHLLLGDGVAALEVLPKATEQPTPLDLDSALEGSPTALKTLALAAHLLVSPSCLARDLAERLVAEGIRAFMKQEFQKPSPRIARVLLWLDLPNVLFGRLGDPWAMVAQVNEMVDD